MCTFLSWTHSLEYGAILGVSSKYVHLAPLCISPETDLESKIWEQAVWEVTPRKEVGRDSSQ